MTDTQRIPENSGPSVPPVPSPAAVPRWMRYALVVSLAANLLVLGVVAGAVIRHDRDGPRGMIADVGFGPYTEALSREDRKALRDAFIARAPDFRAMRAEAQADMATLIAALRAADWDEAAVKTTLAKQRDRTVSRISLGQDLLLERLSAMTPDARRALADRLDGMMRRGPGEWRRDKGDGRGGNGG